MHYIVRRFGTGWELRAHHNDGQNTKIALYRTKAKALTTARLLAGWVHGIVVED
jgi:hypothetical protein